MQTILDFIFVHKTIILQCASCCHLLLLCHNDKQISGHRSWLEESLHCATDDNNNNNRSLHEFCFCLEIENSEPTDRFKHRRDRRDVFAPLMSSAPVGWNVPLSFKSLPFGKASSLPSNAPQKMKRAPPDGRTEKQVLG